MPRYQEKKHVPYQQGQMFDLVADVGRYPQFLPWCVGARIRSRSETELVADLTIGFGPFRESFTSRVKLQKPDTIIVHYENGPFRYLNNRWIFTPDADGCVIDFFVEFEFRSKVLQMAIGTVFAEAVRRMVYAFLKRAHDVYGSGRVALSASPAAAKG